MGVSFNVVGNLIRIPIFGYVGAAVVTILSEFSLLFPFYYSVRRNVGVVPWLRILARARGSDGADDRGDCAAAALGRWACGLRWRAGSLVYLLALAPLGAFRGEDMALVLRNCRLGRSNASRRGRGSELTVSTDRPAKHRKTDRQASAATTVQQSAPGSRNSIQRVQPNTRSGLVTESFILAFISSVRHKFQQGEDP